MELKYVALRLGIVGFLLQNHYQRPSRLLLTFFKVLFNIKFTHLIT